MDLRRFFSSQTWWGKLLCAFLGFLIAGPVGAFFGVLIGNLFDRGLTGHFSNPLWHYHAEKRSNVKKTFREATFSVLGHISKADGRVTKQEIELANDLMQHMNLNQTQKNSAQHFFSEGKNVDFNLKQTLIELQQAIYDNPELTQLFIDTQYRAAQIDGLSEKKIQIMNTILAYMQHAPMHKQARFNDSYRYQSSQKQQPHHAQHSRYPLDEAYTILQVAPTSNKQDVKRAYRRLISKHHPDKLIAQNLPKESIKQANEKTQVIRKAYEQICASKGW